MNLKALLQQMFEAAVAAAQPAVCVPPYLPPAPKGRLIVIGAGKASAAMAKAVEDHWQGPLSGLVVTRYGHSVPCKHIEIIEAAHPVPDVAGMNAARRMLAMVSNLSHDDLVLCLISGGGSALLSLPLDGISLEEKQAVNRELLLSGASIAEMNVVRRHISAIKGGRLAAACHPARVVTLLMSDVPGDNPVDIASGPTIGDCSTCEDALSIIGRYALSLPESIKNVLASGSGETIKPDNLLLAGHQTHLVMSPLMALDAAAQVARMHGIKTHVLSDAIEGESRDVAKVMAGIARHIVNHSQPFSAPCILLSGGETTVSVRGQGRGGRNVEFLLSLAIALRGQPDIYALAADTDGIDGVEEIAGAIIYPDTLERAREKGMSPAEFLDNNDAHHFFETLGDSVITGPTMTNVNDFRAIFISSEANR